MPVTCLEFTLATLVDESTIESLTMYTSDRIKQCQIYRPALISWTYTNRIPWKPDYNLATNPKARVTSTFWAWILYNSETYVAPAGRVRFIDAHL